VNCLSAQDIEAVAARVVEMLEGRHLVAPAVPQPLTAAQVAARIGRSRAWVYDHAAELGVFRLGEVGEGKRPRLAFDVSKVETYVSSRSAVVKSDAAKPAPDQARRRRRKDSGRSSVRLLPVSDGRKESRG
jgi:hypothetical protein